jgi:hypothetical protein
MDNRGVFLFYGSGPYLTLTSGCLWRSTPSRRIPSRGVERMHHLHRGPLAFQAPSYVEKLHRARARRPGEPRSSRQPLAASSYQAGWTKDGSTRGDSLDKGLDRRS